MSWLETEMRNQTGLTGLDLRGKPEIYNASNEIINNYVN